MNAGGILNKWMLLGLLLALAACRKSSDVAPPIEAVAPSDSAPPPSQVPIEESVQKMGIYETRSFDYTFFDQLIAVVDGREDVVIDTSEEQCLSLEKAMDFDGNGTEDLLVRDVVACGGNCCGDGFFFVSQQQVGNFVVTKSNGYVFGEPIVEQWSGMWTVKLISSNMGFGTDPYTETIERFALRNGKMALVETYDRSELPTDFELRSNMFDDSPDHEHSIELKFDLDEDGTEDFITATHWERWGLLMTEIILDGGEGASISGPTARRVGVLPAMTNGMHDLVGDLDDVYRWDGKEYVLVTE